jgi:hypothetical protein
MSFNSLPIHDATLAAVYISWEAARCDIRLLPVGLPPHLLIFEGFTNIELPRREDWGPSSSINSSNQSGTESKLRTGLFDPKARDGQQRPGC